MSSLGIKSYLKAASWATALAMLVPQAAQARLDVAEQELAVPVERAALPVEREYVYRVVVSPIRGNSLAIHAVTQDGEDFAIAPPGLEAISFGMLCQQEVGVRVACGSQARVQLINFVSGKELRCRERGSEILGCKVGDADLVDFILRAGIARPTAPRPEYAAAIAEAREARRGLWADARTRTRFVASSQ